MPPGWPSAPCAAAPSLEQIAEFPVPEANQGVGVDAGQWWLTFANHDRLPGPGKTPNGHKANTAMVKFTRDFQPLQSWTLPKVPLDKFEDMSDSGGSWDRSERGVIYGIIRATTREKAAGGVHKVTVSKLVEKP